MADIKTMTDDEHWERATELRDLLVVAREAGESEDALIAELADIEVERCTRRAAAYLDPEMIAAREAKGIVTNMADLQDRQTKSLADAEHWKLIAERARAATPDS